jgi:ribonuclease HII
MIHMPSVAGVDEAGRGALAGPLVVAACVLPWNFRLPGLDDSKKLTPAQRERLAPQIKTRCRWAVEIVPVEEIDRLNVLWATMEGIRRALAALAQPAPQPSAPSGRAIKPEPVFAKALIDGDRIPPDLPWPAEAVVGGDARIANIAAASILAKTTRDALLENLAHEHPAYGFERHYGYGTPEHFAAIARHGPSPAHRRTFSPTKDILSQPTLF